MENSVITKSQNAESEKRAYWMDKMREAANIDEMREAILAAPKTAPFNIGSLNSLPYTASLANATIIETIVTGKQIGRAHV